MNETSVVRAAPGAHLHACTPTNLRACRCVLLPGTRVGRNALLGSGCTTLPGKTYPAGSVWVGSRGGEAVCLMPENCEEAAKVG